MFLKFIKKRSRIENSTRLIIVNYKYCYEVFTYFLSSIAACAAANLAIGTLNGEQLT